MNTGFPSKAVSPVDSPPQSWTDTVKSVHELLRLRDAANERLAKEDAERRGAYQALTNAISLLGERL